MTGPWCTSYAEVDHVFRSRDWEQGGGRRVPLDLITVMIRNPDHVGRWAPGVHAAEAILFHGGPVSSVANAIPHTICELSGWLAGHPRHEAALTDPAILRLCCNEALRLHPCRARNKGVNSTGIAFGGSVHTCIAMGMAIGDFSGSREDSSEPAGLMVACLRELYQRGIRPDSVSAPEKSGVNVRDEYASYWVTIDVP